MAAISDAEMLVLYNEALQAVATGQSYSINGREMSRVPAKEIRDMIVWLEDRIAKASDSTGGFGLAQFRGSV